MPKVSVVMSVYNGEKYLREAVESILQQTFTDFEFIIIDDGSTDSSCEIIKSYVDKRIYLVVNEENIGLTKSLNKGLALAQGEYIARMDADDISLPQRFKEQLAFLDEHPEVGVLGTTAMIIDKTRKIMQKILYSTEHDMLCWFMCFFENPIVHPSVMFRKEVALKVGGYDEQYITSQDYHLWFRMNNITKLANLQNDGLYLRKHVDNVTSRQARLQNENSLRISSLIISQVLGRYLDETSLRAYCDFIWYGKKMTKEDLMLASDIIYCLTKKFLVRMDNNGLIKLLIVRDAIQRLKKLRLMIGTSILGQFKLSYWIGTLWIITGFLPKE